jgi:hypothetical protein
MSSAPRGGLGLRSRPAGGALSALPCRNGCPLPAGPAGDHAVRRRPVHVRGRPRGQQVGDTRVDGCRRSAVRWVHYEADELHVHHRTTIPELTATWSRTS